MRPTGMRRAAAIPLLLLAAGAPAACGGNPEKEALRAYEARVEDLMAEDARVSARLRDLHADLASANAAAGDQTRYAEDQALPFYGRFGEAAAAVVPGSPRLEKVHATLHEYLGKRVSYLRSMEDFLASGNSPDLEGLRKAQAAWQAAQKELGEKVKENPADRDVAEAMHVRNLYLEQVFTPFRQGLVKAEDAEKALRAQVLPRFERVAERLKDQVSADGAPGALARWVKAELEYFREVAATLPRQEQIRRAALLSQERWKESEDLRQRFLDDLKAHRESLR